MSEQTQAAPAASETTTPAEANTQTEQNLEAQEAESSEASESTEESSSEAVEAKEPDLSKYLKKKLKLKIDGEELEEEFDLSNEEFLTKQFQLAKVAQKRMSERAQLEKEVQEFVNLLKSNPRAVLSDPSIGVDLKEFAAKIIEEEIENSKKSPEQIEKEKLQAELQAIKEEREREKQEARERELAQLEQREAERYDTLITKAVTNSGLPKTPYVVKKIAEYLSLSINEGINVTPDDVMPLVKEEMEKDLKEMFAVMPEEMIEQLVGSETISKIRKRKVAAAKKAPPVLNKSITDTGEIAKENQIKDLKKKTFKEFFGV